MPPGHEPGPRAAHAAQFANYLINRVEAPIGRCLADTNEALGPTALGNLREALALLHKAGSFHGSVDREHVYVYPEGVLFACPRDWEKTGSEVDDLHALERLA